VCSQACTEDQLIAPVPIFPPPYANVGTAPTEGPVPGLLQWGYAMPCFPRRGSAYACRPRAIGAAPAWAAACRR
jgi:hypothetical protein